MRELTGDTIIRVKASRITPARKPLTGDTRIKLSQIKDLKDWALEMAQDEAAPEGTVHHWSDGDHVKKNGKWVPVNNSKKESVSENVEKRAHRGKDSITSEEPQENYEMSEEHKKKLSKFAADMTLKDIEPQKIEVLINTMKLMWHKYKLKKLRTIKNSEPGKPSSGSFADLTLDSSSINNPEHYNQTEKEKFKYSDNMCRKIEKYLKTPDAKDREKYEKILVKFKRMRDVPTYMVAKGHETESEILHEIGHIIADQKVGMINRKNANKNYEATKKNKLYQINKMVLETYIKAHENKDVDKISIYADLNRKEFFAEAFVMYCFTPKQMPAYIRNMVEAVIK